MSKHRANTYLSRLACVLAAALGLGGCAGVAPHLAGVVHPNEPQVADEAATPLALPARPQSRVENYPAARITATYTRLIDYALSLEGRPYRFGGASPETGFDCSGYVYSVFERFDVRLPRDSRSMARALPEVEREQLRPGDLVFFNTRKHKFSHVGIYLGEDRFVHASSSRTRRVMVSDMTEPYWRKRFNGVRRAPLAPELALD